MEAMMMGDTNEITDASVLSVGPRRRGRPRVVEGPSSIVSVRIWADHHDKLVQMAKARECSVADVVRTIIRTAATRSRR